jgi:multiple sugar transport system permease protein
LLVSLDELAIIDGCTYNEYYMANLYLQDKNRFAVVVTSLYTFTGPMGNQYNYICAGAS